MNIEIIDSCAQLGSGDIKGDLLESNISVERIIKNLKPKTNTLSIAL